MALTIHLTTPRRGKEEGGGGDGEVEGRVVQDRMSGGESERRSRGKEECRTGKIWDHDMNTVLKKDITVTNFSVKL